MVAGIVLSDENGLESSVKEGHLVHHCLSGGFWVVGDREKVTLAGPE